MVVSISNSRVKRRFSASNVLACSSNRDAKTLPSMTAFTMCSSLVSISSIFLWICRRCTSEQPPCSHIIPLTLLAKESAWEGVTGKNCDAALMISSSTPRRTVNRGPQSAPDRYFQLPQQ
ncbi:MAG: hypothetical protein AUJ92_09735 [Armatimonadetes bacterium CG2_30_59_28]|nr:MAG: hypothetical protein AUJ92_09735 [Armatimonadetes bacterium CG2_30_59_28]